MRKIAIILFVLVSLVLLTVEAWAKAGGHTLAADEEDLNACIKINFPSR